MNSHQFSIVTPCYNDLDKLASTLASFRAELCDRDELVIVDSSADRQKVRPFVESIGLTCSLRYLWTPPNGVYGALNRGIGESTGEWIQLVCSGDRLCRGSRQQIAETLNAFPEVNVHVFRGRASAANAASYIFSPTAVSVWPSQSIIVHRSVYEREGLYPEQFRLCADQIYYAKIRRSQKWKLHSFVLTDYPLGGLSSGMTFTHLCDGYAVRRSLGQSVVRGMVGAFVLPVARRGLELLLGDNCVIKLKCYLFPYYRRE